jgi:hypothetical protein
MVLRTGLLALFAAAMAGVMLTPAASAKEGDVIVQRACSAGSTVKLKLSEEDGRIETELEVDQNRNGVRWTTSLRRNGRLAATAVRVTRPPSGSFTVRRVLPNGAGQDVVVARATRRSGELCAVRAVFRG